MARAVILAYHSIDDSQASVSVSPTSFRRQIAWLKFRGYECVTVSELLSRSTPGRIAALTFDDGFRSTHATALPILKEFGYTATCFPIADALGKRAHWTVQGSPMPAFEMLSASELSELAAEGWEIGSHTSSHECCVERTKAEILDDLGRARSNLQERLGLPISGFAYPQGCRDRIAEELVAEIGHAWAVTTAPGKVGRNYNPLAIRRVTVGRSTSAIRFLAATLEPIQAVRREYYAYKERPFKPHTHPSNIYTTSFK